MVGQETLHLVIKCLWKFTTDVTRAAATTMNVYDSSLCSQPIFIQRHSGVDRIKYSEFLQTVKLTQTKKHNSLIAVTWTAQLKA